MMHSIVEDEAEEGLYTIVLFQKITTYHDLRLLDVISMFTNLSQ